MNLGETVRLLRLYKGLTQEELADKIGATQSYVNYIETKGLSMNKLQKIAETLDMELDVKINFREKVRP